MLEKVTAREQVLNDPTTPDGAREAEVRAIFKQRESAEEARLKALESGGKAYLAQEKNKLVRAEESLKASRDADPKAIKAADDAVKKLPGGCHCCAQCVAGSGRVGPGIGRSDRAARGTVRRSRRSDAQ